MPEQDKLETVIRDALKVDHVCGVTIEEGGDTFPYFTAVLKPCLRGSIYSDIGEGEAPTLIGAIRQAIAEAKANNRRGDDWWKP